jgi:hypothetical protein
MLVLVGVASFGCLLPIAQEKDITEEYRNRLNKSALANFTAASINVTRDAAAKRLTIYSFSQSLPTKAVQVEDYSVQIIFRRELAAVHAESTGSYVQHYHGCLLDFAAAQFAEGKKAFGLGITKLLAQADPSLSWSSLRIDPLNIKQIVEGMEADDGRLADLLKEAHRDWLFRATNDKPR